MAGGDPDTTPPERSGDKGRPGRILKESGILWLLERNRCVEDSLPVLRRIRAIHLDPGVRCLKDSRLRSTYVVSPCGAMEFGLHVKAYRTDLMPSVIRFFWRGSQAYREWRAARRLSRLGVSAPTPVAFGHVTDWRPGGISDYVVTVYIA